MSVIQVQLPEPLKEAIATHEDAALLHDRVMARLIFRMGTDQP